MIWFDAAVLAALIVLTIRGWSKGLIGQLFRYLSLLFGVLTCIWGYPKLSYWAQILYPEGGPFWLLSLGLVALFFAAVLLVLGLGKVLGTILQLTPLGPVDKGLGALFGVLKLLVLLALITLPLVFFPLPPSWVEKLKGSPTLRLSLLALNYWKDNWSPNSNYMGYFEIHQLKMEEEN